MRAERDESIDTVRGIAIVLMILDHVLLASGVPIAPVGLGWIRCTVTRVACPLFFMVAGVLWARRCPSWQRMAQVALICPLTTILLIAIGGPPVDILTQYVVLALGAPLIALSPVVSLMAGALQSRWVPLVHVTYEWGYLAEFAALGVLVHSSRCWPSIPWLAAVGRRPLTWYVSHLVVLVVLVLLLHR